MLSDRGYTCLDQTDAKSEAITGSECVSIVANGSERIFVWIMDKGIKAGVGHIRTIHDSTILTVPELKAKIIIITSDNITCTAKRMVLNSELRSELFTLDELKTNRIYHKIQPTFRKVPLKEIDAIMAKYNIEDEHSWTTMKRADFVARYFDWSIGTIVECERCFQGIHQISYRRVVA